MERNSALKLLGTIYVRNPKTISSIVGWLTFFMCAWTSPRGTLKTSSTTVLISDSVLCFKSAIGTNSFAFWSSFEDTGLQSDISKKSYTHWSISVWNIQNKKCDWKYILNKSESNILCTKRYDQVYIICANENLQHWISLLLFLK